MIIVISKTSPGVVYAYHTSAQELTVKEAYAAEDFSAFKAPTQSVSVGDEIDTSGFVAVDLQ